MKISQQLPVTGRNESVKESTFNSEAKKSSSVTAHSDEKLFESVLQQMRQMPDIDSERVANTQAVLSAGELDTNSVSLAQAMMDFYRS